MLRTVLTFAVLALGVLATASEDDTLNPFDLKTGQIGKLPTGQFNPAWVYQVLGEDEMHIKCRLVTTSTPKDTLLSIKGVSTKDLSDGKPIVIREVLKVKGTKTFKLASGGMKTIHTLETISADELAAYRQKKAADEKLAAEMAEKQRLEEGVKTDSGAAAKADSQKKSEDAKALREEAAASRLKTAKKFITQFGKEAAIEKLDELIEKYPGTKACDEAKRLRKELKGG